MPRLKLHQIALALAVSAALTACGEKTAQTTETPQAASAASAADAAASTAAVSAPQNSADVSAEDKARDLCKIPQNPLNSHQDI